MQNNADRVGRACVQSFRRYMAFCINRAACHCICIHIAVPVVDCGSVLFIVGDRTVASYCSQFIPGEIHRGLPQAEQLDKISDVYWNRFDVIYMGKIILASASPRRKMLLDWAEVEFEIRVKETDEQYP